MGVRASDYPPPFSAREFVAEPTDPADERIEVGILIVGAGPAGLACAIRLGQLLKLVDIVEAGSEVKALLAQGVVMVNGEVETRRGRQLVAGDQVSALGVDVCVVRDVN